MPEHPHEADRLESLRSYAILDTEPEAAYDELTHLAAMVCNAPIALVTIIDTDRQWFKSRYGTQLQQTDLDVSLCAHPVAGSAPLIIADAPLDVRFAEHKAVAGRMAIKAYAGIPLIGRDGLPLGTLCVLDLRPRLFTPAQITALTTLARQVVNLLEIRRSDMASGRGMDDQTCELNDPVRLRTALDKGEFLPHFQPIVDLDTGTPRSLEALLRWHHPEQGVIAPYRFLPAIESSALMLPVGRLVLRHSLAMLARLRAQQPSALLGVAVNVSLAQLAVAGLAATVADELQAHAVPADMLTLELTESAALFDDRVAVSELHALRELGVRLAIDDYGTGYSSLLRVLDLPITALKLDRSLVMRLPGDRRAMAVARSTLDLTAELGIGVVAEGIETQDQRQALLDLGCTHGQGYLFSRPLHPEDLADFLAPFQIPRPRTGSGPSRMPLALTGS